MMTFLFSSTIVFRDLSIRIRMVRTFAGILSRLCGTSPGTHIIPTADKQQQSNRLNKLPYYRSKHVIVQTYSVTELRLLTEKSEKITTLNTSILCSYGVWRMGISYVEKSTDVFTHI